MGRSGRWFCKKNPKKRGFKSFLEKAKLQKNAGFNKRILWRRNKAKKDKTMKRYRYAYRLVWKLLPVYLAVTGLPQPETCPPRNQHGGVMPAMPDEFDLTNRQAGTILEKIGDMGTSLGTISYPQLKAVSAMLGYLWQLKSGKEKGNWSDVSKAMSSFRTKDFTTTRPLCPTKIPTPAQMVSAFTSSWRRNGGMSLVKFCTALLATWCWALWGCRPNVDLKSIKKSEQHTVNEEAGWACTAYFGGRNKLPGKKAGTRPWNVYFVCMCPNGDHRPIPAGYEFKFQPDGNPNFAGPVPWCTECPINCFQLKLKISGHRPMHLFSKWTKTTQTFGGNHGDVVALVFEFLRFQGIEGSFDRHAGRRCCAGILEEIKAPFHVGFEHHGDNPDVWIKHYQPNLEMSQFARRTQSPDPRIATTGLRMWQHHCGRDHVPVIPTRFDDFGTRLMVRLLREMGRGRAVEEEMEAHRNQD